MSLETVQSTTAGMHVRWQDDSGAGPDPTVLYMLRWETLDSNRDMPRTPIPPATASFVLRRTKTGAAGIVAQEPPFNLSP